MSHFSVAVLHREDQDIDDLLAPYNENIEVEKYRAYTRQEAIDYVREAYKDRFAEKTDDQCWEYLSMFYLKNMISDDGSLWSTYNPKSKWDWWVIGGRFSDVLEGRFKGSYADWVDYGCSARIKDIDFSLDEEEYEYRLKKWDKIMDGSADTLFKTEYYEERYEDREEYAKRLASFSTHAVVTPDGEWHEIGECIWFGMSTETPDEARDWDLTYKERFIDTADPDLIMTIVDCHI